MHESSPVCLSVRPPVWLLEESAVPSATRGKKKKKVVFFFPLLHNNGGLLKMGKSTLVFLSLLQTLVPIHYSAKNVFHVW